MKHIFQGVIGKVRPDLSHGAYCKRCNKYIFDVKTPEETCLGFVKRHWDKEINAQSKL
jgi:hypothetical protein